MDYREASKLQPGDRVLSVGDEHFIMKFGGFLATGKVLHVTEDCKGVLIERDAGGRIWVSTAHIHDYSLEGERRQWRLINRALTATDYRSGPYDKKTKEPATDSDPQRLLSRRSLREVRGILVELANLTRGKDAARNIFDGVGLDHIDHIQPWHHDVIFNACEAVIGPIKRRLTEEKAGRDAAIAAKRDAARAVEDLM